LHARFTLFFAPQRSTVGFVQALAGLALLLCMASAVQAQVYRLDDSASPRSRVNPRWVTGPDGRALSDANPRLPAPSSATVKFGRIDYKLATANYMGKKARIYYVVPAVIEGVRSPSALQVSWPAATLFAAGTARPGERAVVWSGTIAQAWMADALDVTMQINLRELRLPANGQLGFESYFEIEVLP
jgi:hypothetical protein